MMIGIVLFPVRPIVDGGFELPTMLGGRSDGIVIVIAVMLAVSLVTVCLRCFVRLQVVKAFGWDDGLMVIAMASSNL
jgi:hypothetical protein